MHEAFRVRNNIHASKWWYSSWWYVCLPWFNIWNTWCLLLIRSRWPIIEEGLHNHRSRREWSLCMEWKWRRMHKNIRYHYILFRTIKPGNCSRYRYCPWFRRSWCRFVLLSCRTGYSERTFVTDIMRCINWDECSGLRLEWKFRNLCNAVLTDDNLSSSKCWNPSWTSSQFIWHWTWRSRGLLPSQQWPDSKPIGGMRVHWNSRKWSL